MKLFKTFYVGFHVDLVSSAGSALGLEQRKLLKEIGKGN